MKRRITLNTLLCCWSFAAMAQIPNAGFENWTGGNPDEWSTSNQGEYITVSQDATSHGGSSAVKLQVVTVGPVSVGGTIMIDGFAQNSLQPALRGWYKGSFVSGDLVQASCSINSGDNVIRLGSSPLAVSGSSVYQEFIVNLSNLGGGTPDNANISFVLTGPGNVPTAVHPGSFVLIDDLSWGATGVGVDEAINNGFRLEKIFPNPAGDQSSFIQYWLEEHSDVTIEVYDLPGNLVQKVFQGDQSAGHYRAELDCAALSAGTYTVKLQANNKWRTMLFVK